MPRRIGALAIVIAWAAQAEPTVFDLDPDHTFAHFEVLHFGTSTLRGRFGPLSGQVTLDAAAGRGRLGIAIPMATLSTGLKPLDARLARADLLDLAGHREAYFVAERFSFQGEALTEVRGEFTLRGTGAPLSLRALRFGCLAGPPRRCGGDFEGELRRGEFGADFGLPLVADRVRLLIQVEGVARR